MKNLIDIKKPSDKLISSIGGGMAKKKCERKNCNKEFEQIVPWKKYCSPSCKQIAWALRQVKK